MIEERERFEHAFGLFEMPEPALERLLRRRDRKRRNQRIVAGVVAIAVFVAAVWIVTTGGPFGRTQMPAAPRPTVPPASTRVGFIGLPPEGATPSTPESGELVLSFVGSIAAGESPLRRVYVYADGRLIWDKHGDLPYGANEVTTGFLEQHLTPKGVERLRSEIISTGLFAHDLALLSSHGVIWGSIQVREGDRLVSVDWSNADIYPQDRGTVATPEQASALEGLDALLADPASWLPASAWEDREIRAYVPSRYEVCYGGFPQAIEPSRILALLPAPAGDLLGARDSSDETPGQAGGGLCFDVTTEEARALAAALDDAGLEQGGPDSAVRLEYQWWLDHPRNRVLIWFEPYLPHGEVTCSPCG